MAPPGSTSRLWLMAERAAWSLGAVCFATWAALSLDGASGARRELDRFTALQAAALDADAPPLAVLRIPQLRLEVAVLPGTDDFTLNRAVGHIEGTAPPGADGNSGIAGHRDGFFRGLKDIAAGAAIEIDTRQGTEVYRVERTWVVDPTDVSVLDPTPTRSITLVTCYPFYHVGPAPHRFIVRATRAER